MENKKDWLEVNDTLTKTFVFADFKEAWAFLDRAAVVIDNSDHHPVCTINYNKVSFVTTTHDAGNKVTDKDWSLAHGIDEVL